MDLKTVVSSKGQVVIPKVVRESLGIHAGSELLFHVREDNVLEVQPVKRSIKMFFNKGSHRKSSQSLSVADMDKAIEKAVTKDD